MRADFNEVDSLCKKANSYIKNLIKILLLQIYIKSKIKLAVNNFIS